MHIKMFFFATGFAFLMNFPLAAQPLPNKGSAAKPTALQHRLIKIETSKYDGTAYHLNDSTVYVYSGERSWEESTKSWKYDMQSSWSLNLSQQLEYRSRTVKTYDANENLESEEAQLWKGGQWQPFSRTSFSYQNGLIDESGHFQWFNNQWQPTVKTKYTYDAAGVLTEDVQWTYDEKAGVWEEYRKHEYHRSPNGVTDIIVHVWGSGTWTAKHVEHYFYQNGLLVEFRQEGHTLADGWRDTHQRLYHYSANSELVREDSLVWNTVGKFMDTAGQIHYSYNGNKVTAEIQLAANGVLTNQRRVFTWYNSDGRPLQTSFELWNDNAGVWELRANSWQQRYYYDLFNLSVDRQADEQTRLRLYPVPAAGSLHIDVNTASNTPLSIAICSQDGRLVRSWTGEPLANNYHEQIDLSGIAAGSYLLRVHSRQGQIVKPFSVVR